MSNSDNSTDTTKAAVPSPAAIRQWVLQCLEYYTGCKADTIKDDFKVTEDPLSMDRANLVDLAGTLRHGIKNYNRDASLSVDDIDDVSVGDIVQTVSDRIRGGAT